MMTRNVLDLVKNLQIEEAGAASTKILSDVVNGNALGVLKALPFIKNVSAGHGGACL